MFLLCLKSGTESDTHKKTGHEGLLLLTIPVVVAIASFRKPVAGMDLKLFSLASISSDKRSAEARFSVDAKD